MIRAVQVGIDGRIGKAMERTANEMHVAEDAKKFLDAAVEAFPQLAALQLGQVSTQSLRESGLLGSPAMLRALGGVYFQLMSDKHQWSREKVIEFFKVLNPHMAGGAYPGSIWMRIESTNQQGGTQKAFTEGAFAPNGLRQALVAVEDTLVEWALLGPKGAPFLWAEPAPRPEPQPTEDEISLAADIEADPDLETLLAEKASFDQKVASTS
ncbi:MAG: hypothetical protein RR758_07980 [Burkholderiaceae bacterium]